MWIERATVTDGSTLTGLYAPDGSFYVVLSNPSAPVGVYHASGGYNVTVSTTPVFPAYAPNGSLYISETVYLDGGGTPEEALLLNTIPITLNAEFMTLGA